MDAPDGISADDLIEACCVTVSDKQYLSEVSRMGCAICRRLGLGRMPAEVHHQRTGTGAGRRASNRDVAPLCPEHHRGNTGLHGMGRKAFEDAYGVTELELVEETRRSLETLAWPDCKGLA